MHANRVSLEKNQKQLLAQHWAGGCSLLLKNACNLLMLSKKNLFLFSLYLQLKKFFTYQLGILTTN